LTRQIAALELAARQLFSANAAQSTVIAELEASTNGNGQLPPHVKEIIDSSTPQPPAPWAASRRPAVDHVLSLEVNRERQRATSRAPSQ